MAIKINAEVVDAARLKRTSRGLSHVPTASEGHADAPEEVNLSLAQSKIFPQ
ncbi:hypothetical protein [Hyalangium gracile]|uniref:hypothetical protein n=1 Tax=Hyalangium gracile TaxID=394092 RepID=UPI001CCAB213|nr:hypothetical protein [Hyalangium gracile]